MATYQYDASKGGFPSLKPDDILQISPSVSYIANKNGTFTQQGQGAGGAMTLAQLQSAYGSNSVAVPQSPAAAPGAPGAAPTPASPSSSLLPSTSSSGVITSQGAQSTPSSP